MEQDKIITSSKEIYPYRRYQLLLIWLIPASLFFGYHLYFLNKDLSVAVKINEELKISYDDEVIDNENARSLFDWVELNYLSIYKLNLEVNVSIIRNFDEFVSMSSWIDQESTWDMKFKILYKATKHGDNAKVFHELVNGYSPLIFLFETVEGYRFGAYINDATTERGTWEAWDDAFLFSFDAKAKFKIQNKSRSFGDLRGTFPLIGESDIFINDNFLHEDVYCSSGFPHSYVGNGEYNGKVQVGNYLLTGGVRKFKLKEMEVLLWFSS